MTEHPDIARIRDGVVAPEVEAHLATCPRCRVEARLLARVAQVEARLPDEALAALRAASARGAFTLTGTMGGREGASSALAPGELVDRYRVERPAGSGGMAVVYRVRHERLGSLHALKVMAGTSARERARLEREGRAQGSLRHPNVVAVTDIVDVHGAPGLILDWVDGPTLAAWLREEDPVPLQVADRWAQGILRGVAAAHRQGFVHRDLKPANVMLARGDDGWEPRVTDFGLVRALDDATEITRTGIAMGTPSYMSPEQIRDAASADARSDVFSLGAVLYELLAGRRAFAAGSPVDQYERIRSGSYDSVESVLPGLPERIARTIARALRPDPAERFADAGEMLHAWSAPTPTRPVAMDRRVLYAAGALVAIGVAAWVATRGRTPEAVPEPVDRSLSGSLFIHSLQAISADGQTVAVLDGGDVWALDPDGGPAERIAEVGGHAVDFFPDGRIAVLNDEGLWSLTLGGDVTRVLSVTGRDLAIAPDGERLAFTDDAGLWVVGLDGVDRRLLVPGGDEVSVAGMAWSPSGRFVASTHIARSSRDVWLQISAADGSVSRRVTWDYSSTGAARLAWVAPDRLIGTVYEPERTVLRVWEDMERVSSLEDVEAPQVYEWLDQEAEVLGASSGGDRILYLRAARGTSLVSIEGGRETPLPGLGPERGFARVWPSPDEVLVCERHGGTLGLHVLHLGEGTTRMLVDGVGSCRATALPDALLFWRWKDESPRLHLVRREGDGVERELASVLRDTSPVVRCAAGVEATCVIATYEGARLRFAVLDPATGETRAPFLSLEGVERSSAWDLSPDGSTLALPGVEPGSVALHRIDGGPATTLDAGVLHPQFVAWGPTGDRLYVAGMVVPDGPTYALVELDLDGGIHLSWTSEDRWMFEPSPSPDGRRVAAGLLHVGSELRLLDGVLDPGRPLPGRSR